MELIPIITRWKSEFYRRPGGTPERDRPAHSHRGDAAMSEYVPVVLRADPPCTGVLYGILLVSEGAVLVRSSKTEVDREITAPNPQTCRYTTGGLAGLGWNVFPLTRIG